MNPIYLFEAGSTKTLLLIHSGNKTEEHTLPGFNPNRYSDDFESVLRSTVKISPGSKIFFYGSGLVEEANKQIVRNIFQNIYGIVPDVSDDVTCAARAGLGNKPGLVAIMGTGGVAAYYDGVKIVKRNGGHGYLIDDYGGGLELGKIVLSAWLNGDLPEKADEAVQQLVKTPKADFVREFYISKDLSIPAAVVKIIPGLIDVPEIKKIASAYFAEFFSRHVAALVSAYKQQQIFIVGSVGTNLSAIIEAEAAKIELHISGFDNQPGRALLAFHLSSTTI